MLLLTQCPASTGHMALADMYQSVGLQYCSYSIDSFTTGLLAGLQQASACRGHQLYVLAPASGRCHYPPAAFACANQWLLQVHHPQLMGVATCTARVETRSTPQRQKHISKTQAGIGDLSC